MGILNITPDSFSDGGRWVEVDAAIAHAQQMVAEGAEIIDVGGESTRPGAESVDEQEEMRRVIPVIEKLATLDGHGEQFVISIDTMKAAVARAAIRAGASIVNDVTGLRDTEMIDVVKESGAGVVVMHMQGGPNTMQLDPHYSNVAADVREFLCHALERCLASGVAATQIALDPGIGFGKTPGNNLALLRRMSDFARTAQPIVVGVSRKSFIGNVLGLPDMAGRSWPTVALTCHSRERGARVFRVHEVKPNMEALRMTEAILGT